jgi:hypothetical protein
MGEKSISYSDYSFSHFENSLSHGNVEFSEQIYPESLSRKYKPTEIATFTVNTLPIPDKSLIISINRIDIERKSDCSADSLTLLIPSTFYQKNYITKFGPQSSDYRLAFNSINKKTSPIIECIILFSDLTYIYIVGTVDMCHLILSTRVSPLSSSYSRVTVAMKEQVLHSIGNLKNKTGRVCIFQGY